MALLAPAAAQATDFTVTNLSDDATASGPAGSLHRAIFDANAAVGPDRILFQAGLTGTITLAANLPTMTGPTSIVGPGAGVITVDGDSNYVPFTFNPTVAGDPSSISGLKITGGNRSGGSGAGVSDEDGAVTISNSTFFANDASSGSGVGGAIGTNTGPLTITNSSFQLNVAFKGGAVYTNTAPVSISGSTINGNIGKYGGGGVFSNSGDLTISNSTFRADGAEGFGGAVDAGTGGLSVTNSRLTGNTGSIGAGIYADDAPAKPATIIGSSIENNSSKYVVGGAFIGKRSSTVVRDSSISGNSGAIIGGMAVVAVNPVTIENSTFYGNFGSQLGGGLLVDSGSPTSAPVISSSTISGNATDAQGGGIVSKYTGASSLPLQLRNTLVGDNTGASNPDIDSYGTTPKPFDIAFSLVETPGTTPITQTGPNVLGQDAKLGTWGNNGGTTKTQPLLAGSPAIDAGNTALTTDQRGLPRPSDAFDVANVGNGADIGAFEVQQAPAPAPVALPKCNGTTATIVATSAKTKGTNKADVIVGRAGSDNISGLGGNDTICGLAGNDKITGGAGNDTVDGGSGNDKLFGSAGKDTLRGAAGKDLLVGGPGKDKLNGGSGKDTQKQ